MMPKTLVLHCRRLGDRKASIERQFGLYGFGDYSFFEEYDPEDLSPGEVRSLYEPRSANPGAWEEKVLLWGRDALRYHSPVLNPAEVSLTVKFGKAFQRLAGEDFDYCVVFEDDVILCDGFEERFLSCLSRTPDDWDAIYFGCCAGLHVRGASPDRVAYLKPHPASRGGDSTVLRKRAVADLASTWFPFNLVSDWELGAQHHMHGHRVYWWEPPLTRQGSETGLFGSTLR